MQVFFQEICLTKRQRLMPNLWRTLVTTLPAPGRAKKPQNEQKLTKTCPLATVSL